MCIYIYNMYVLFPLAWKKPNSLPASRIVRQSSPRLQDRGQGDVCGDLLRLWELRDSITIRDRYIGQAGHMEQVFHGCFEREARSFGPCILIN